MQTVPIQLKKIERVLAKERDAQTLIAGTFLDVAANVETGELDYTVKACKSAGRCAIGALLWAAGVDPKRTESPRLSCNGKEGKRLKAVYGLTPSLVKSVIATNDNHDTFGERFEEVMAFLTFAEMCRQSGVTATTCAYEHGYDVDDDGFWE